MTRDRQLSLLTPYPEGPGAAPTDTSIDAAEVIAPSVHGLRLAVLNFICGRGLVGATADEVAAGLSLSRFTARPRCTELRALGSVVDSGARRRNSSGRAAIVWVDRQLDRTSCSRKASNE